MLHLVEKPSQEALERGGIVQFVRCPVELPPAEDQDFLREGLAPYLKRKNVSWYPGAGKLLGLQAPAEVASRAARVLGQHSQRVRDYLTAAMPDFTRGWEQGTCSFRPLEERGRGLSPHASNELVHVDAGAYGATHGDRILRFFVNLNPSRDRVWISRGGFEELFRAFGAEAGVVAGPLKSSVLGRLYSSAVRAFPMGRVIDT